MKRPGVIAHGWLSTLLALLRRAFLMIIVSVPGIAFGASFDDAAVLPDPPLSGQRLSFVATLPAISCFNDLIVRDVVTTGREIKISYSITPAVTPICFSTSPPLFLNEPIGVLAPGSYTVRALGDFNGAPVTPVEVRFNVPTSPAAAVEYYRAEADHYFIASALDEIAKLDAGDFDGWQRTGQSFPVVPATLSIADAPDSASLNSEYPRLYARFADLIAAGESDVDLSPLHLVTEALRIGEHVETEPFAFERGTV